MESATEIRHKAMAVLDYDQDTGIFTWKATHKIAGGDNGKGYLRVRIEGKWHRLHRLAWTIIYGHFPKGEIDHLNGDTKDNRIANLADKTKSENQRNRKSHREGRLFGASYNKGQNKWFAQTTVKGQFIYLGTFDTELQAHQVVMEFESQLESTEA